ncbi:MAG: PQQ-dependent sugar dehydrogenase [Acidobacteria bacterium]|nr:PQQ-dependent sugar dehydrogenase [Acidobacteriota bacterium]
MLQRQLRSPVDFLLLSILLAVACGGGSQDPSPGQGPTPVPFRVETFLANLNFPVTLAFAPDGRLFFNELQTGNVRIIENGQLLPTPFASLPVETSGERGLLGLAFDPNFASNRFVYLLYSDVIQNNQRVVKFTDVGNMGMNMEVVVDNLPSASIHNGGNIGFGRDAKLYITIGDSSVPANSQDMNSLAGKILRYDPNGTIPTDNPFGSGRAAFNRGLRNSFDFTFHPTAGTIYASENGPQCDDEVNRIVAGGNYGWRPSYPCGDTSTNFIAPLTRFNPTIAPTGICFYTGTVFPQFRNSLFLVDFNTGRVRRFVVDEANQGRILSSEIVVDGGFGQLLDIVQGPDGFIYFSSTSAILRLVPQ